MQRIITSFSLPPDTVKKLKAMSSQEKRSISNMAEILLENGLKQQNSAKVVENGEIQAR